MGSPYDGGVKIDEPATDSIVVKDHPAPVAVMLVVIALVGAGIGWLLQWSTGWLLGLGWIPFRGPIRLIDGLPDRVALPLFVGLGAVLGLVLDGFILGTLTVLKISRSKVAISRGGKVVKTVAASGIAYAFMDRKELVLLDVDARELLRHGVDLDAGEIAEAAKKKGLRWVESDPQSAAYRLWIDGIPGLPPGGDVVLRARAKAIAAKRTEEILELRSELNKLGIYVRDDKAQQYVRAVAGGLTSGEVH